MDLMRILEEQAAQPVDDQDRALSLYGFLSYPYMVCLGQIGVFPESAQKNWNAMRGYAWLLDIPLDPMIRPARWARRIVGYHVTCRLLSLAYKLRYRSASDS
jgi:hypothetical protein